MDISAQQFNILIETLKGLRDIDPHYTITGAADWPLLLAMGGVLAFMIGLLIVAVRYMHSNIIEAIKDGKAEWKTLIKDEALEREKQDNHLWDAVRACQEDCCPRRSVATSRESPR